jgi:hypothetical protein
MSKSLVPIDAVALHTVTGGKGGSSNPGNIDGLINQLNSITGSISTLKQKTSGFGQTEMLMLCFLAMQRNQQAAPVVYVSGPRRGWYW